MYPLFISLFVDELVDLLNLLVCLADIRGDKRLNVGGTLVAQTQQLILEAGGIIPVLTGS
jgi:hypothetical protein